MAKGSLNLPISGGIYNQATSSVEATRKLRHARNCYYRRDDPTLRRRKDIKFQLGPVLGAATNTPISQVTFEDTNRTFKKVVVAHDVVGVDQNELESFDPETLTQTRLTTSNSVTSGTWGKPAQYNNTLYWPVYATITGQTIDNGRAWNGATAGTRELGININFHMGGLTTLAVNTAGAGSLTFTTGRSYTWTLYDSVAQVESMPANNGATITSVTTGAIVNKGPVVSVTWNVVADPNRDNTSNNHDTVRFYATTDGGTTYYHHTDVTIANPNLDGSTVNFTDSMADATLVGGDILVYNSPPPPARFYTKFENKLVGGGSRSTSFDGGVGSTEPIQSNVLYYSLADEPEHWPRNLVFNTQINAIPFRDQEGDELMGGVQVNRILLVGLRNSIWTINHLPIDGVDPLFNFDTLKDRIVNTHGFVSHYCYTPLQLIDDEDAAFYVSHKGFHINTGSLDRLVSGGLKWDKTIYNDGALELTHVVNDLENYMIIIGFPSVDSDVVDAAYVYHYHPSQLDEDGVGKITGPWDYDLTTSSLVRRTGGSYEVWGMGLNGAAATFNLVNLSGVTGLNHDGSVTPFEWETGWIRPSETQSARVKEISFLIEEQDSETVTIGDSTISQTIPKVRFLQTNCSGPAIKIIWDDDALTIRYITGTGGELQQILGMVEFTTTDRALITANLDVETYGEEKTLASGIEVAS